MNHVRYLSGFRFTQNILLAQVRAVGTHFGELQCGAVGPRFRRHSSSLAHRSVTMGIGKPESNQLVDEDLRVTALSISILCDKDDQC